MGTLKDVNCELMGLRQHYNIFIQRLHRLRNTIPNYKPQVHRSSDLHKPMSSHQGQEKKIVDVRKLWIPSIYDFSAFCKILQNVKFSF